MQSQQHDDDSVAGISTVDSVSTPTSSHPELRPILVGYAFGPKKMSTMGIIMAEASKATPVTAEIPISIETTTTTTPAFWQSPSSSTSSSNNTNNNNNNKRTASLTTAALEAQSRPRGVKLSVSGGPTGAGLRNIVRHFRSSCCSSVATSEATSTTTTTSLVPTTTTTTTTTSSSPQRRHPVRVSFVPLDLDSPLEEQHGGHQLDAILHKLTEDILCLSMMEQESSTTTGSSSSSSMHLEETQVQARGRVHRLNRYQQEHPQCCLIDHPSHVQVVMSRSDIAHVLQRCLVHVTSASGLPVRTPRFEVVHEKKEKEDGWNGSTTPLRMPLIAKPLPAAGTKMSHRMGIVLSTSGLAKVNTPCLLQEYANHNATLFKVYVLGSHISVFERPSLPNLDVVYQQHHQDGLYDYVEFDSQRPYPTLADFGVRDVALLSCCSSSSMPPPPPPLNVTVEEVRPVVQALREAFGLELFGFDILVTSENEGATELLVVDVNYFPSYKEVSNFPSLLASYLTKRAIEGRMRDFSSA